MGQRTSTSSTCYDCQDPIHFYSEDDLDSHQMSIHWCLECVKSDQQSEPFLSYISKQNHIICECSSTSKLAHRTRGMSTYDSSTSSANIRKRFLPETFDGHHLAGLSNDDICKKTFDNARLTFAGKLDVGVHRYYFDIAVPGNCTENYTPDDIMGCAVTCCFEAALHLLRGETVTTELCDRVIEKAILEDGAERARSISSVYMHDRYSSAMDILVDKEVPLVKKRLKVFDPNTTPNRDKRKRLVSHERTTTTLPQGWTSEIDAEGSKTYTNRSNGVETWTAPIGSSGSSASFKIPSFPSSRSTASLSIESDISIQSHRSLRSVSTASTTEYVDTFDMTSIDKLKEYSKTTPLVAILTRSPSSALVVSFDLDGHATMFLPFCASAQSCVFFGFKATQTDEIEIEKESSSDPDSNDEDMLGCQLFEEFPPMTEDDAIHEIRKHWNTFRITVLRGKIQKGEGTSKSRKPRPSVMGLSGLSDSVAVPGVRRRSNCIFSENELTARFAEFRFSTLQAHGKPTLTSLSQVLEARGDSEDTCTFTTDRSESLHRSQSRQNVPNLSASKARYTIEMEEENKALKKEILFLKLENDALKKENLKLKQIKEFNRIEESLINKNLQ